MAAIKKAKLSFPLKPFIPLLSLLTFLFVYFGYPQPLHLVKIIKGRPLLLDFLKSNLIQVIQELESCYLARMIDDELVLLEENRFSYSIIDHDIGDRVYLLVHAPSPRAVEKLSERGKVFPVEKDTVLFWVEHGDPDDFLPPEFARSPLPSESILPFLQLPYSYPREKEVEVEANEVISQIIDSVSADSLQYFVQSLEGFVTRYASTANCEAAGTFIYNYFLSLGLTVSYQPFTFKTTYNSRNIIAEIRGNTHPDDLVIICGHYDSTSKSPTILAPGADDNASGTAAVMEAARVLANYPLDFTARFIAFSAEEHGLYGSRAYAADARSRNERIIGVINLDMIAYADSMPEDLEVIVNSDSEWMAEKAIQVAETYVPLVVRKTISPSFVYSDHAAFWERGYDSLCGIEDNPVRNPYYHTINDISDTLNFEFFTSSTKVSLAELAELAQPIRPGYPRTPTGLTGKIETYSSLFNSIKNVSLSWNSSPDAIGYNVYRTTMPHVFYEKLNNTLITGTSFKDKNIRTDTRYYYAVRAVNGAGRESNFSREFEVLPEMSSLWGQVLEKVFLLFRWSWLN